MDEIKKALLEERKKFVNVIEYYKKHKIKLLTAKAQHEVVACIGVVEFIDAFIKVHIDKEV